MIKAENNLNTDVNRSDVSRKAEGLVEQGKEQATELGHEAQHQVKAVASDRKEKAVNELSNISEAFRHSSEQLRQQNKDTIANYTDKAADQIERFSSYLDDKNVNELLGDAQDFAQRHPEIFLGGAFALGLMAARFMKSSGNSRSSSYQPRYSQNSYRTARPAPSHDSGVVTVYDPYRDS
jgi:hypothetical protein